MIGKKFIVVLYFGVMLLIVVWFGSESDFVFLLKNLMNLLMIFFLCSILVIVSIRLVVVMFLCSLFFSLMLMMFGVRKYIGWLSMLVFVLMLFMF